MVFFKEEEQDFVAGAVVLIDKPLRWTSFDVVNKSRIELRRYYGKMKVGHAGTLDPLATGLVILCTGRCTKQIENYMAGEKEYVAEVVFGATTPSFDRESEINARFETAHLTPAFIEEKLAAFRGTIMQSPPRFSAVRVDGDRAYRLARRGEAPEMEAKPVVISRLEVEEWDLPRVVIRVVCGKGTYIRSLADDLGRACGSGAYLSALRRTRIGDYRVEDALSLDAFARYLSDINSDKSDIL